MSRFRSLRRSQTGAAADLLAAACHEGPFFEWLCPDPETRPVLGRAWMRVSEQESMVRLAVDFENPSSEWWEAGGRDLWQALIEGFDTNDVVLERAIAKSWLEQAARIAGWAGGPEFAPHPIRVKEIAQDEEL